jgi:uncharacterized protein (DUF849 family)
VITYMDDGPALSKTPIGGPWEGRLLEAALNGARPRSAHPALPLSPEELVRAALEAAQAGADAVHMHVRDRDGHETLAATDLARTVTEVRRANVPIGISTGAWIVPDPLERLAAVRKWSVLPDFASVNFDEPGATELAMLLLERGVGVEAGIANRDAAEELVRSGLAQRCLRILLEPGEPTTGAALRSVAEAEAVLDAAGVQRPRLLHGMDATAWTLLEIAGERRYQTRIGLEDTLTLPNGEVAAGNGELVRVARQRLSRFD